MKRLREETQVSFHIILHLFNKMKLRMELYLNQFLRLVVTRAP